MTYKTFVERLIEEKGLYYDVIEVRFRGTDYIVPIHEIVDHINEMEPTRKKALISRLSKLDFNCENSEIVNELIYVGRHMIRFGKESAS